MAKTHKNICMLVIASRSKIYDGFIRFYWKRIIQIINQQNLSVQVYFVFGSGKNKQNNDDLGIDKKNILNFPSIYESRIPGIFQKTIKAFEFIQQNHTYHHIIRTNLSSFFILSNLIRQCNLLPHKNCYAGVIGYDKQSNTQFVSGACYILSKDQVEIVLKNEPSISSVKILLDDVVIGKILCHQHKIQLGRCSLRNRTYISHYLIKNYILKPGHFHVRMKTKNRKKDLWNCIRLTNAIYK